MNYIHPRAGRWLVTLFPPGRCACPWIVGQSLQIDAKNSKVIVHVWKAGLFSAFGDNHEVEAPISEGFVDEGTHRVKLVIDAGRLKVLDPHLPSDKRQQVQERMLGADVLDVAHFPRISFESAAVEQTSPDWLLVRGQLSLHGQTRMVISNVRIGRGSYVGTCTFKQQEFGITPVSIAGGTVKVKDKLTVEFDIRPGSGSGDARLR